MPIDMARDYLPHLCDPAIYTVIDEVRQLPLKVSDIYRRLTTWAQSGNRAPSSYKHTIQPCSGILPVRELII
ncbi:MAG: hypothetical protein LJE74_06295 [Proteobacteria bacterium]|jgi:hypothetical protein|nr:hypothetical protein [Pseudomonadota bacterium]